MLSNGLCVTKRYIRRLAISILLLVNRRDRKKNKKLLCYFTSDFVVCFQLSCAVWSAFVIIQGLGKVPVAPVLAHCNYQPYRHSGMECVPRKVVGISRNYTHPLFVAPSVCDLGSSSDCWTG